MFRPLSQFCCGCTLVFGVKLILAFHMFQNAFYISTSVSNVIFKVPSMEAGTSLGMQSFNAMVCLAGVPFILAAWWAVRSRNEPVLRLYLYYVMASFLMDFGYLVFVFVLKDTCARLPTAMSQGGAAFACGATRMLAYGLVGTLAIIQLYCIFAVWSLCEDFQMGCSDHVFEDLQADIENSKRRNKMAPYGGILGHSTGSRGPFPAVYASTASAGVGGSTHIFGGEHHETNYPPEPRPTTSSYHKS